MNCAEVKYYLNDYTKGILLDEVRAEIHEHLNGCTNCAKAIDDIISLGRKNKKSIRHNKKNLERVYNKREKKGGTINIDSESFSSVQAISSGTDNSRYNLLMKASEIENNKLLVIALIISAIVFGVIFAFLFFDNSSAEYWAVQKISGYPVIESSVLNSQGIIKVGEKLITDSESKARLKVGAIGEIDIEPESEIQIVETKSAEYKLVLLKGKISARTWSVPKLFSINTPSAAVKDLGCEYYLSVNADSSTMLFVNSGWVLMENGDNKSLLPAGTSCYSKISKGAGTPFYEDASQLFKQSLYQLDFENAGISELKKVLSESRKEDLISLFHLLKRLDQESREIIFDRIASLFKMPQRITREGIVSGNNDMMARLWTELGLGSISIYQNL